MRFNGVDRFRCGMNRFSGFSRTRLRHLPKLFHHTKAT